MTAAGSGDYTEPVTVEVTGSPGTSGGINSYLAVVIVLAAVIFAIAMAVALVGTGLVYKKLRNTKSSSAPSDPAVASEPPVYEMVDELDSIKVQDTPPDVPIRQHQNEAYAAATEVFLDEVKLSPNAAYGQVNKETAGDVAKREMKL